MGKFASCNMNRHTANAGENAEVINAHSDAIENLELRVRALELLWTPPVLSFDAAPDPAEVILAQRDKLMSILRDKGMRVWTQALTSIFVAALRDAGRDDDDADE